MKFDINLWQGLIDFRSLSRYPSLPCPYCNQLKLVIDYSSFQSRKIPIEKCGLIGKNSKRKKEEFNKSFDIKAGSGMFFAYALLSTIELLSYDIKKFIVFLKCQNCNENVSADGTAKVKKTNAEDISIKIEHFSPAIPLFELKESTPKQINQELLLAFDNFHSDLTGAGAKLRRAMEKVCLELGFSGKTLHASIQLMKDKHPDEHEWLSTLKLIGNEATHSDGIEEEDLLLAFKVFEEVIEIFDKRKRKEALNESLKAINQKFKTH